MWNRQWAPYVPVAARRRQAKDMAAKMAKKGEKLSPVHITGRNIANTFWGKAWCENLECYQDFANRLPRGRTYARNGSIIDLQISAGIIKAMVSGSSVYKISIEIEKLPIRRWKALREDCAHSIHSLMDLLQGKFSDSVMQSLTEKDTGLFPAPKEIKMSCSCPDYAYMCKHLAAVLYGIGNRLDKQPELLFLLRNVNHQELIDDALSNQNLDTALTANAPENLGSSELSEIFGIELSSTDDQGTNAPSPAKKKAQPSKTKTKVIAGKVKLSQAVPKKSDLEVAQEEKQAPAIVSKVISVAKTKKSTVKIANKQELAAISGKSAESAKRTNNRSTVRGAKKTPPKTAAKRTGRAKAKVR